MKHTNNMNEYSTTEIRLEFIDDFPNHPFKVIENEDMNELVQSIREHGLITPIIVRTKEDGRYELVSGHRRKKACKLAGLKTIKAEIRELNDEEALLLMVDSNLQRSVILPSEKAFSYRMRLDAMKHQGERTDLTCEPLEHKLERIKSRDILAQQVGESKEQVRRYIRLTYLIPELLELVDNGRIALRPAVEISNLSKGDQKYIWQIYSQTEATPSYSQAVKMRKIYDAGFLTVDKIAEIMYEAKPNQREKVSFLLDDINDYIPPSLTEKQMEIYVINALKFYKKYREHKNNQSKN